VFDRHEDVSDIAEQCQVTGSGAPSNLHFADKWRGSSERWI